MAMKVGQAYSPNTYYQILLVDSAKDSESKNITTKILARQRGDGKATPNSGGSELPSFDQFKLDDNTITKLEHYPKRDSDPKDKLYSYLPSSGVTFPKGFIDSRPIKNEQNEPGNFQTNLGNFYVPMRTLLHSRKLSQLIAKSWWAHLQAKENDSSELSKFTRGEWHDMNFDILDGLIAREIFLFGGGNSPDEIEEEEDIYKPLKPHEQTTDKARFLILPSSKSWQGISLSLLLAGQAYYKTKDDKYHQISQPIFSTGEITVQYSLEVDWNRFEGYLKEFIISKEKPWIAYHAIIPYPPIPPHADSEQLKKWADAKEDPKEKDLFPFYKVDEDEYLIDVDYFRPPYPYIPLTCT